MALWQPPRQPPKVPADAADLQGWQNLMQASTGWLLTSVLLLLLLLVPSLHAGDGCGATLGCGSSQAAAEPSSKLAASRRRLLYAH